jgi:hypothetical protein
MLRIARQRSKSRAEDKPLPPAKDAVDDSPIRSMSGDDFVQRRIAPVTRRR